MASQPNETRRLVREKLNELGLSMKDASLAMGKNHAYLQQYLERGTPAELSLSARKALAAVLSLPQHVLAEMPLGEAAPRSSRARAGSGSRIPILGIVEGGEDGWSIWNGNTVDFVDCPPSLHDVSGAYAAYVVGASMEPRYFAGEIIYAHPAKPVTVGSFVILQVRPRREDEPPRALIKRVVRRAATKVVLEQFNPARSFDVAAKDIISMHRVIGSTE